MKKRMIILPLIALSLGLAACEGEDTGTSTPTEESSDENGSESNGATSEVNDEEAIPTEGDPTDPDYVLLEQAKEEYYAGDLDSAEETLTELLENDLSDKELLEAEAEDLLEEITEQQEESEAGDANAIAASTYLNERMSFVLREEYEAEMGQPLSEASDEELEAWLAERELQKSKPIVEVADETDENTENDMTKEEAENYAFEQVWARADVEDEEDYFYFVNYTEENWVQVEARQAVDQNGVIISNLIGMYRYNVETDEMQELDIFTGEYTTVQ